MNCIGDGTCDKKFITPECGYSGGDYFEKTFPNCQEEFTDWIGNGICDGGEYSSKECGYDGGDCL